MRTLREKTLPRILQEVFKVIEEKLNLASNICSISDIWTTFTMFDFIGIAVSVIYDNFDREIIVIGMELMPGNHCAEHIAEAIMKLFSRYNFNKAKIIGIHVTMI